MVERVHKFGALAIASVYPVSLGILKTPGEMGLILLPEKGKAGDPLSFGGPYLGFMAARTALLRQMPEGSWGPQSIAMAKEVLF